MKTTSISDDVDVYFWLSLASEWAKIGQLQLGKSSQQKTDNRLLFTNEINISKY